MRFVWLMVLLWRLATAYSFTPFSQRLQGGWLGGCRGGGVNGNKPPSDRSKLACLGAAPAGRGDDELKIIEEQVEEESVSSNNPLVKQWLGLTKDRRDDIKTTSASFLFALFVRLFLFEPRFIPSLSMFPTFEIGDQLLVDKVSRVVRTYQRQDVVVFNPPEAYVELTGNTEALIKRVVAVEGDVVEVKSRHLFVNGVQQEEEYTNELPDYTLEPLLVPKGMLLVLGDNRNHSFDSHVWGFLPSKNVIGRAVVKYWPPWRVGAVEGSH